MRISRKEKIEMSNLGWYQILTTMAKKVGGPKKLMAILVGSGALLGGVAVAGANEIKKKVSFEHEKKRQEEALARIYTVKKEGRSNEGLLFLAGDTFKVLEFDGDAVLIEKIGDNNNPYFVSRMFLSSISDYVIR